MTDRRRFWDRNLDDASCCTSRSSPLLCLHSVPLDDVHVVLRTGVVAVGAQASPEVTPQPTGSSYHGGHDGPEGCNRRGVRKRQISTCTWVPSQAKLMMKHLQVLFDENFQRVLVLEDDFDVHAEKVIAVHVLTAEIARGRQRHTQNKRNAVRNTPTQTSVTLSCVSSAEQIM